MTDRDTLADAGDALYGSRWQTDLSRALGVSDRTVRRWASGSDPVPNGVWGDVSALLRKRAERINRVLAVTSRL